MGKYIFTFLLKHENLFFPSLLSMTTTGHLSPRGHETRVKSTHSEKSILLYTSHTLIFTYTLNIVNIVASALVDSCPLRF